MFGLTWIEIGALVVGLWAVLTLRFVGSVASRVDKALRDLGFDDRDDPGGLPGLTEVETGELGHRLGEAGILPADWDRVWRREYLHAQMKKRKAAGQPAP